MALIKRQPHYTHNVLMQMTLVFVLLITVVVWQSDVVHQIYIENQINAVGWVINGSIITLFLSGLTILIRRFLEYRGEEASTTRFLENIRRDDDPLLGVDRRCMMAKRYETLRELSHRGANINHNALAATLLAKESSRNSFLRFVQNVLILTGVFGTIISLSISLLGASGMMQSSGVLGDGSGGLGVMIFGMSTALSTTMTAILAYLIFGYFYIKLTDTQTYLISSIEEVTATTLLPHLQPTSETVVKDYSDSLRSAQRLIEQFGQSQKEYSASVQDLRTATQQLAASPATGQAVDNDRLMTALTQLEESQQQSASQNRALLSEVIRLLQEGFRLQDNKNS